MARYYSDRLISGRVGNQVFCIRNGKTYVRAYVKHQNAASLKQRIQQARLKATVTMLKNFTRVISIGFQSGTNEDSTEFARAVRYHIHNALVECIESTAETPLFEIPVCQVRVAEGEIDQPQIFSCTRACNDISLTWDNNLGNRQNRYYDQMVVVAYTPGKKVLFDFSTGTRIKGKGFFRLPDDYTEKVHLWVFYFCGHRKSTPSREHISTSKYLGVF